MRNCDGDSETVMQRTKGHRRCLRIVGPLKYNAKRRRHSKRAFKATNRADCEAVFGVIVLLVQNLAVPSQSLCL